MWRSTIASACLALGVAACSSSAPKDAAPSEDGELIAQVASYELTTGRDQRVIVGLQQAAGLVSFGKARFSFGYLGTTEESSSIEPGPTAQAYWIAVPGQKLPSPLPTQPKLVRSAEGVGVYGATARFDRAGFWQVTVEVPLDGTTKRASAKFVVNEKSSVVNVGDAAPRSNNLLPGAKPPTAVDSRAATGTVPDEMLHRMTISDAVVSGRPTMIVISTPVYCVSRFCGPITDTVATLARRYGKRMNFVHLEVWRDFQKREMNQAAADWIFRDRNGDLNEPWVYVVASNGKVSQRFDNVASDNELTAAVQHELQAA